MNVSSLAGYTIGMLALGFILGVITVVQACRAYQAHEHPEEDEGEQSAGSIKDLKINIDLNGMDEAREDVASLADDITRLCSESNKAIDNLYNRLRKLDKAVIDAEDRVTKR